MLITTERKISYDDKSGKYLVRTVIDEEYSQDGLRLVYENILANLKKFEINLEKLKELDFLLRKMENDSRFKELVESILKLTNQSLVDRENIRLSIKDAKEKMEKLKADLDFLEPHIKKDETKRQNYIG